MAIDPKTPFMNREELSPPKTLASSTASLIITRSEISVATFSSQIAIRRMFLSTTGSCPTGQLRAYSWITWSSSLFLSTTWTAKSLAKAWLTMSRLARSRTQSRLHANVCVEASTSCSACNTAWRALRRGLASSERSTYCSCGAIFFGYPSEDELSNARAESISPTAVTRTSLVMRLTIPLRTAPGPNSTKLPTPEFAIYSMDSCQRTQPQSC